MSGRTVDHANWEPVIINSSASCFLVIRKPPLSFAGGHRLEAGDEDWRLRSNH